MTVCLKKVWRVPLRPRPYACCWLSSLTRPPPPCLLRRRVSRVAGVRMFVWREMPAPWLARRVVVCSGTQSLYSYSRLILYLSPSPPLLPLIRSRFLPLPFTGVASARMAQHSFARLVSPLLPRSSGPRSALVLRAPSACACACLFLLSVCPALAALAYSSNHPCYVSTLNESVGLSSFDIILCVQRFPVENAADKAPTVMLKQVTRKFVVCTYSCFCVCAGIM